jgi:hypothetical protein
MRKLVVSSIVAISLLLTHGWARADETSSG